MKKKSISLLIAALSVSLATASAPFNGFYLGASGGYTQKTVTNSVAESSSGNGRSATSSFINSSYKNKISGFVSGLMGGYGRKLDNGFYLGGEATLQYDTVNKTKTSNLAASDGSVWPFSSKYKRGLVFGAGPRFGMTFDNSLLAYGKVGLEISRDKISHQNMGGNISSPPGSAAASFPSGAAFSGTKTKMVVVPGVGLEQAFNNILARVEYNYNPGAKINQTANYVQNGISNSDNQKIKYASHALKLGLAYKF